jgi:hypothetical protein
MGKLLTKTYLKKIGIDKSTVPSDKTVIAKLGKMMDMEVCIVNGDAVRKIEQEFVIGGHPLVYPKTIRNAFWIEYTPYYRDLEKNLFHEVTEYLIMKYGNKSYDYSHKRASAIEKFFRHLPDEFDSI